MHITAREFSSRLIGRLLVFVWIAFLVGATGAKADPVKTLVQDTLYRADGSVAHGTITIRWNGFSTGAGEAGAAGVMTVSTDANGRVSFPLVPNTGSSPAGSYYRVVIKTDDGITSEEQSVVPAVPTTTIAAIRAKVVPQAVAAQFASRDYVDSALAALEASLPPPGTVAVGVACPKGATAGSMCSPALPISILAYGAKCDGKTDDTSAIQAAFNAAVPNGVVTFPPNKTCYVATGTGTITLPGDDGTFQAGATCNGGGACSTLAAEPVSTMPYAINVPGGVEISGNNATIVGNFQMGVTMPTLASLFIFNVNGSYYNIHDLNFQNIFSPFVSYGLFVSRLTNINIVGCGFVALTQKQDRAAWDGIVAQNCAAGIINGGWWNQRNNVIAEAGGYADKNSYRSMSFIQNTGMYYNTWAQAFDTFFDTYFWKSVHNTDGRLTDVVNTGYDTRTVTYEGVYGVGIAHYARNIRFSVGNVVDLMMHYGSPRYAFLGQKETSIDLRSIDVEQVGWGDGAQGNCPFGVTTSCTSTHLGIRFPSGIANPYVSGKLDGVVNLVGSSGIVYNLNNDAGGSISAAIDIGGGSALTTFGTYAGNTDTLYNMSWLASSNVTVQPNGTGTLSLGRGGLQGQYGLKYYDNAANGDANTRTCIETAGSDTMCFPRTGGTATLYTNLTFNRYAFGTGSTTGQGLSNPTCAGTQGTASTLGTCRFGMGRGGYDLGFGLTYFDDVTNGDANTHASMTYGITPISGNAPVEWLTLFLNGAASIGENGARPASGYGLEIGPSTLFDVSPVVPTPSTSDNSTKAATTAWVKAQNYATTAGVVTAANNLSGATTGMIPYQSATSTTAFVPGNTAATDAVLTSTGTGSAAQAPTLKNAPALSAANMTNFPPSLLTTAAAAASYAPISSCANGPFPAICWSGALLTGGSSGNRAAANFPVGTVGAAGIAPPANGQYRVSMTQLMVTPGTGTGTIATQVLCTPPGGTTNQITATSGSFSAPTLAAGSENYGIAVMYCASTQPFQWLITSGNGSATISAYVVIERLQ